MQRSRAGGTERLSSTLLRFTPTPIHPDRGAEGRYCEGRKLLQKSKVAVSLVVESDQQIHAKIIIMPFFFFFYKANYNLMFVCY